MLYEVITKWMVDRAVTGGECFEARSSDSDAGQNPVPAVLGILPLVVVLVVFLLLQQPESYNFV